MIPEHREYKALLVHRVQPEHKAHKVIPAPREPRAVREHRGYKEQLGHRAQRGPKVHRVFRVRKVIPALKVHRAILVLRVRREFRETSVE